MKIPLQLHCFLLRSFSSPFFKHGHFCPLDVCKMLLFFICTITPLKPLGLSLQAILNIGKFELEPYSFGQLAPFNPKPSEISGPRSVQPVWICLGEAEPQQLLCTASRHRVCCMGSIWGLLVSLPAACGPPCYISWFSTMEGTGGGCSIWT